MVFEKVMKFGGAALADGNGVLRVCRIVERYGPARPILVVSAHQGVTDLLETVARSAAAGHLEGDRVRIRHRTLLRQLGLDSELLDRYFAELFGLLAEIHERRRLDASDRDAVLSFGERMSARVVAHALRGIGVLATPVDAFDLGLVTDSNHGEAEPLPESQSAVREALAHVPGVPVVTGFLAIDERGNLTTLGRNGSDLTAALIAEALGANELELWKAVAGIMTADPSLAPDARGIERLGFQEAAEFALHGAEVVHEGALAAARRSRVALRIRNVHDPESHGTLVDDDVPAEGAVGIAAKKRVARVDFPIAVSERRAARTAEVFRELAERGVDPIALSAGADSIRVYLAGERADGWARELGHKGSMTDGLSLAAVIGRSTAGGESLAARALTLLEGARIEVVEATLGHRRASQSFIVHTCDLERAVRALHTGLIPAARTLVHSNG